MTKTVLIAIAATSILSTSALAQTTHHHRTMHARAEARSSLAMEPVSHDTSYVPFVRHYDDRGTMPWWTPEGDSLRPEDWRSESNGN